MKGKIALINLLSVGAGIGIVLLSMYALTDGPRGWAVAHAMGWIVWVVDLAAVAIMGLTRLAGIYYFQNEIAREEHQSQLERTLQQTQQLEQENELLCEQLEELEDKLSKMERNGFAPQALEEARQEAARLKNENSELRVSLDTLTHTNRELEARLLSFEARFLEADAQLTKAMARIEELERVHSSLQVASATASTPRSIQTALTLVQQLETENTELVEQVKLLEEQHNQTESSMHRTMIELKEKNRELQAQLVERNQQETPVASKPIADKIMETLLHEIENVLTNLPSKIAQEAERVSTSTPLELVSSEREASAMEAEEPVLAIVSNIETDHEEMVQEDEDLIFISNEDWRRPLRPVARRNGGGRAPRRIARR